ncbi:MAG TPA: hypothetical protein VMV97_09625 [Sulfuriferula sp.]|nr:hypothetical protein [Sulfuriferula sp.]
MILEFQLIFLYKHQPQLKVHGETDGNDIENTQIGSGFDVQFSGMLSRQLDQPGVVYCWWATHPQPLSPLGSKRSDGQMQLSDAAHYWVYGSVIRIFRSHPHNMQISHSAV